MLAETKLLSLPDVRQRLGGISRAHLYRVIANQALPVVKLGRRSLVKESDLEKLIADLSSIGWRKA